MNNKQPTVTQPPKPSPKTNEQAAFQLSAFIRISDPKTGEVLLQKRSE